MCRHWRWRTLGFDPHFHEWYNQCKGCGGIGIQYDRRTYETRIIEGLSVSRVFEIIREGEKWRDAEDERIEKLIPIVDAYEEFQKYRKVEQMRREMERKASHFRVPLKETEA